MVFRISRPAAMAILIGALTGGAGCVPGALAPATAEGELLLRNSQQLVWTILWQEPRRARLAAASSGPILVARAGGDRIEVLEGCRGKGRYDYAPFATRSIGEGLGPVPGDHDFWLSTQRNGAVRASRDGLTPQDLEGACR